MQNRILKSIMIISLCVSYSQAEEETGLIATIKSFFGAIPPQDGDRGEGTSRTLNTSPQKVLIDNQHTAASDLFSDAPNLDGSWKETLPKALADHALPMEEPGRLMPEENQLDQSVPPTISETPTPLIDPRPDLMPGIEVPLEPTNSGTLLNQ
jgi:hypothetical protein